MFTGDLKCACTVGLALLYFCTSRESTWHGLGTDSRSALSSQEEKDIVGHVEQNQVTRKLMNENKCVLLGAAEIRCACLFHGIIVIIVDIYRN